MTHTLKILPTYFQAIVDGRKTDELRQESDRVFAVGDTLRLREWVPPGEPEPGTTFVSGVKDRYTGRECRAEITHIIRDTEWLQPGVAALSIRKVEA